MSRPIAKPDFFLVGAPKCGTTALHRHLARHPEIFVAAKEEMNHFATDLLRAEDPWRSERAYLEAFRDAGNARRIGDASVFHLFSTTAAREIHAFEPDARILVMLRDPVDWLPSYHSQMLFNGDETLRDLAAALAAEPARVRGAEVPAHLRFPQRLFYSRVGAFAEQLERYFEVFGRERVHVVIFDDLVRDSAASLCAVLEFLGVDAAHGRGFELANPNRTVRSAAFSEFLKRPPDGVARLVTALLPAAARQSLRRALRRLNSRSAPREPLPPGLRAQICERFRPEVARLERLLGRALPGWCDPARPRGSR
jgi:hypothetical protein